MSKRRSEDENAAPAKRGGAGYIGRRKEHRFEDVGDAKARLLDSLSTKAHVGGARVLRCCLRRRGCTNI